MQYLSNRTLSASFRATLLILAHCRHRLARLFLAPFRFCGALFLSPVFLVILLQLLVTPFDIIENSRVRGSAVIPVVDLSSCFRSSVDSFIRPKPSQPPLSSSSLAASHRGTAQSKNLRCFDQPILAPPRLQSRLDLYLNIRVSGGRLYTAKLACSPTQGTLALVLLLPSIQLRPGLLLQLLLIASLRVFYSFKQKNI